MEKPTLSVALIGHFESGKSSLASNIKMEGRNIIISHQNSTSSVGSSKSRIFFSKSNMTSFQVEMKKFYFQFFDCPGNKKYFNNFFKGFSIVDCCIMTVSSEKDEFEKHLIQIKDHIFMVKMFEIKQIVFVITKMDHKTVDFSLEIYQNIKEKISLILEEYDLNLKNYQFIPSSKYQNDNISTRTTKMKWYNDISLFEALESLNTAKREYFNDIIRIPILRNINVRGIGRVITGMIVKGELKGYPDYYIAPCPYKRNSFRILSKEKGSIYSKVAYEGDHVGINVRYGFETPLPNSGFVVGDKSLRLCKYMIVKMKINCLSNQIRVGSEPLMLIHSAKSIVKIEKVLSKIDFETDFIFEEYPKEIKDGDCLIVQMSSMKKVSVEEFDFCPKMGRFVLYGNRRIIAIGFIQKYIYEPLYSSILKFNEKIKFNDLKFNFQN